MPMCLSFRTQDLEIFKVLAAVLPHVDFAVFRFQAQNQDISNRCI